METQVSRRMLVRCAALSLAGLFLGCGGPDNPRIAEAPAFKEPPSKEPPKIPGRSTPYGASEKYQRAMEKMGTNAGS